MIFLTRKTNMSLNPRTTRADKGCGLRPWIRDPLIKMNNFSPK
jgi:hypothetical protein